MIRPIIVSIIVAAYFYYYMLIFIIVVIVYYYYYNHNYYYYIYYYYYTLTTTFRLLNSEFRPKAADCDFQQMMLTDIISGTGLCSGKFLTQFTNL